VFVRSHQGRRWQKNATLLCRLGVDYDPTPWLGRQFTPNELELVQGCPSRCRSFNRVQVGKMTFRIASKDAKFKTCQCYFKSFDTQVIEKVKGKTQDSEERDR